MTSNEIAYLWNTAESELLRQYRFVGDGDSLPHGLEHCAEAKVDLLEAEPDVRRCHRSTDSERHRTGLQGNRRLIT